MNKPPLKFMPGGRSINSIHAIVLVTVDQTGQFNLAIEYPNVEVVYLIAYSVNSNDLNDDSLPVFYSYTDGEQYWPIVKKLEDIDVSGSPHPQLTEGDQEFIKERISQVLI